MFRFQVAPSWNNILLSFLSVCIFMTCNCIYVQTISLTSISNEWFFTHVLACLNIDGGELLYIGIDISVSIHKRCTFKFLRPHYFQTLGLIMLRWATSWENLFMPYVNNKGADQPTHPRSLISTFVVWCLDSIIPPVSLSKISNL